MRESSTGRVGRTVRPQVTVSPWPSPRRGASLGGHVPPLPPLAAPALPRRRRRRSRRDPAPARARGPPRGRDARGARAVRRVRRVARHPAMGAAGAAGRPRPPPPPRGRPQPRDRGRAARAAPAGHTRPPGRPHGRRRLDGRRARMGRPAPWGAAAGPGRDPRGPARHGGGTNGHRLLPQPVLPGCRGRRRRRPPPRLVHTARADRGAADATSLARDHGRRPWLRARRPAARDVAGVDVGSPAGVVGHAARAAPGRRAHPRRPVAGARRRGVARVGRRRRGRRAGEVPRRHRPGARARPGGGRPPAAPFTRPRRVPAVPRAPGGAVDRGGERTASAGCRHAVALCGRRSRPEPAPRRAQVHLLPAPGHFLRVRPLPGPRPRRVERHNSQEAGGAGAVR